MPAPRHHRRSSALALATAGIVLASALPAAALEGPAPVGDGAILLEDFQDVSDWTALSGPLANWTVSEGTLSIDTRGQASGNYIRPSAPLTLPEEYELRTSVKVDGFETAATISLIVDMLDPGNFRTRDLAVQLVPRSGAVGVQVAAPLTTPTICAGATPLGLGEWASVLVRRADGITGVWIDDQLVVSVGSTEAGGTIALGSYKSQYSLGPISIDPVDEVPADHPTTAAGCPWQEPPVVVDPGTGTGVVSGDGEWVPAAATTGDRPGSEVVDGEETIGLGGDWRFTTDPGKEGVEEGYHEVGTDVSGWDTLPVPGNWDVHDRYGTYKGTGWYRRTFETGDLDATAGQRAWLRFDAVYWSADVWLNGQRLGGHVGGYTPFEFDVTDYLVDGENTLVVAADNSFSQGAWWSWGGISRPVTLVRTNELAVDRQEIVATPDLAAGTADVDSTVVLRNSGDEDREVTVSGSLTTSEGESVPAGGTLSQEVTVPAGGTAEVELSADLAEGAFELWQLDDPELYRFDVELSADGDVEHHVSDRFGIRSFVIDGTAMLLNGERVKLTGANRVSDNPVDGNVEPVDVVRRDMDLMKASGVDFTRIMHYPQAPELLDYADEIGMLLIVETPVWGQARQLLGDIDQIQREFREMVERDFNHPSIIAYSVANEVPSNTPNGVEYSRRMAELSRSIDPSRYVTQALHETVVLAISDPAQDGSQWMDFVSINSYGGFAGKVDHIHEMYDDVPIFVSEYSPDGFTFGIGRESNDFRTGAASTSDVYRERDFVAGWSQWTYNDYRSVYDGSSPNLVRGWGYVDVWGREKRAFDQMQTASASVAAFELGGVSATGDGGIGLVTVRPRGALDGDGPGRLLSGYTLMLRVMNAQGDVVGGGVLGLPDIAPGDPTLEIPVSWRDGGDGVTATVGLLSPQGYEVAMTQAPVRTAPAPEISEVVAAQGAVRVRWYDAAGIGEYRVEARAADGSVVATVDTAESFADLGGLTDGETYAISVSALTSAGAGDADSVDLAPQAGAAMAPRLHALTAIPDGLVLGFSDGTAGARFQVQVTDAVSGAVVQEYTTANRPGTRIEGLEGGVAYDVRIRRLDGGEPATVWSEPLRATALSEGGAPALDVRGLIAGSETAGIVLEPTAETERYRVTVRGPGVDRSYDYERAAVNVIPLTGLQPDAEYSVEVRAVSAGAASEAWSGTVRTGAQADADPVAPVDLHEVVRGEDVVLAWSPGDDAAVSGYIITREHCGVTTVHSSLEPELVIGAVGLAGGTYTVRATSGGAISAASEPLVVPSVTTCTHVVEIEDVAAREDGSIPFKASSGWLASSLTGPDGHASLYADLAATPDASATWTAPVVGSVRFRVEVALPDSYGAAGAVYTVHAADGDHEVPIHQGTEKGTWVDLGEFEFDAAHPGSVTLDATGGGFLRASAVRFVPVSTPVAPQFELSADEVRAGGSVQLHAEGLVPDETVAIDLGSDRLGTFRADGSGVLDVTLRIPAATPAGAYELVLLAVASGQARADLRVLAVAGGGAVPPSGEAPERDTAALAFSGTGAPALPWAVGALLLGLVLLGAALVRRRRSSGAR